MKKFLTMCEGGNVRSVALAYTLKHPFGQNALACGWRWNPMETRIMLFEWADYIILMQPQFRDHVPEAYHHKCRCVDVGVDNYGTPMHPDLRRGLHEVVQQWHDMNWEI